MSSSLDKVTINTKLDSVPSFGYSSLVMPTCRLDAAINFLNKWHCDIPGFPRSVHLVFDGFKENIPNSCLTLIRRKSNSIHLHSWDALFVGESISAQVMTAMPPSIYTLIEANSKCFSTKDSAIRSYGFIVAAAYANAESKYSISPNDHVIYSLDDDCLPIFNEDGICDFFIRHTNNLLRFNPWSSTVPGIRVRGVPYYTFNKQGHSEIDVVMSMGAWRGIPDFDAVQRLSLGDGSDKLELPLVRESILAHRSIIYPICGMNLAFKSSMLPAALFAPMGSVSAYKRFDDIWFGLFAQAVLKLAEKDWCYGQPLIYHDRLSAPMNCLVAEAPGIKLNEVLWMYINDAIVSYSKSGNAIHDRSIMESAKYVIKAMSFYKDMADKNTYGEDCLEYVNIWCECLTNWVELLNKYVFNVAPVN